MGKLSAIVFLSQTRFYRQIMDGKLYKYKQKGHLFNIHWSINIWSQANFTWTPGFTYIAHDLIVARTSVNVKKIAFIP